MKVGPAFQNELSSWNLLPRRERSFHVFVGVKVNLFLNKNMVPAERFRPAVVKIRDHIRDPEFSLASALTPHHSTA